MNDNQPNLFSPLPIRDISFKNRIMVSPMCEYSSIDGFANDWHIVHLGSRAVGGAALVMAEATAVTAQGRISPEDLGIWKDEHIPELKRITDFIKSQDSIPGIQLAHAGRKASTYRPFAGDGAIPEGDGGWQAVAPSAIPFNEVYPHPTELTTDGIRDVISAFANAASRALQAGFEVIELHSAHGYLLHEFLSPLSNLRTDEYGGSFDNRIRIVTETIQAVRQVWPKTLPLFVRISATDWAEGGWDLDQSVELARRLGPLGVDLIDCSSGGLVPYAKIKVEPGYQVPFAEKIKRETGILTGAVGMITEPEQANEIIHSGTADLVIIARELLRHPYWPLEAAYQLKQQVTWPRQYAFAERKIG